MPAVLVEVGFINTDADNELYDSRFDEIARAIAEGIRESICFYLILTNKLPDSDIM